MYVKIMTYYMEYIVTQLNFIQYLSSRVHIEHALFFLFIFFFSCCLWLSINCVLAFRELGRVISGLDKIMAKHLQVDGGVYKNICELMDGSKMIAPPWREFDETAIKDEADQRSQIYNTRSFGEFFPKEEFLQEHLNTGFFRKVPALVTSIGLFFTFLFIIFGLMHLEPQPSGKIDGVSQLITGLSAKFQSSVFAILYAVLFTVFEDRIVRVIEMKYTKLVHLVDRKFVRKSGEEYLRTIDRSMRLLNENIEILNAERLKKGKPSEKNVSGGQRAAIPQKTEKLGATKQNSIPPPISKGMKASAIEEDLFIARIVEDTQSSIELTQKINEMMKVFHEVAEREALLLEKVFNHNSDSKSVPPPPPGNHSFSLSEGQVKVMGASLTQIVENLQHCTEFTKMSMESYVNQVEEKLQGSTVHLEGAIDKLNKSLGVLNENVSDLPPPIKIAKSR